MAEIAQIEAGARLTVDLGAIIANYRTLCARAPGAVCAPVVKADAYGLGAAGVVPALLEAGADTFFVAQLSEARELRALAPRAVIYVLNGLVPGSGTELAALDARPVLGAMEEVEEWAAFCSSTGKRHAAALQIDTGMNRLGLSAAEARALAGGNAGALDAIDLALVMSHFIASEIPGAESNGRQIAAFEALRAHFPGIPASMANSSGVFLDQKPHYDLVRPGYALYGGNPTPGEPNPMRAVVTLEARIARTRIAEAGESVGYDATWTAKRRSHLAIATLGYADGLPWTAAGGTAAGGTAAGGTAAALVAGRRCPIVGRISMDLFAIDVTDLGEGKVRRGDFAAVIAPDLTIDELARASGTIGYDVLTGLGQRCARAYLAAGRSFGAARQRG
ncbi:MAG TPA: alanine racemase [Hyphomicrobiales bacterium]|nr:alanine racemase [Rhodobiaceae bacterium]HXK53097.1 alanine racemase [Hyphomicrobiales bacterium]